MGRGSRRGLSNELDWSSSINECAVHNQQVLTCTVPSGPDVMHCVLFLSRPCTGTWYYRWRQAKSRPDRVSNAFKKRDACNFARAIDGVCGYDTDERFHSQCIEDCVVRASLATLTSMFIHQRWYAILVRFAKALCGHGLRLVPQATSARPARNVLAGVRSTTAPSEVDIGP